MTDLLGKRPAKETDLLPVERNMDIGLDDLAAVALSHDEVVVVDHLRHLRDSGQKVATMTPQGIALMERLTARVRAKRGLN